MKTPQIIIALLSNSDGAVFVNGHPVYTRESTDIAISANEVGENLALALDTNAIVVNLPSREQREQSWSEVYKAALEELSFTPLPLSSPGCCSVLVAQQEKYGKAVTTVHAEEKDFSIEVEDRREAAGLLRVGIAPVEGEIDDFLDVTLLVDRVPGSRHDSPALHFTFDGENEAGKLFRQQDRYVLCLGPQAVMRKTMLSNGAQGYLIDNY